MQKWKHRNGKTIQKLGIVVDKHSDFYMHIKKNLKDGCSMLKILKKLKRFALYETWKHLVVSLVLSKVDYCNIFFKDFWNTQDKELINFY